jgi:hypothetical protein
LALLRPKIKELQTIQRQEKNEAENQGITDNTAPRCFAVLTFDECYFP